MKHSASHRIWTIRFLIAAAVVWIFYTYVMYRLPEGLQTIFQNWLPPTTVNEAMVWVICALGLNIVVGYAGLLDLGFVAFWAIGGYSAGWFMSAFFGQVNIHILTTAPEICQDSFEFLGSAFHWWIDMRILRDHYWRAYLAVEERLFGTCHFGVWRNYPAGLLPTVRISPALIYPMALKVSLQLITSAFLEKCWAL